MNKIGLIIAREFITRIRKRSFIIITLLGPVFFAALLIVPTILALSGGDEKTIEVVDESGYFKDAFENTENLNFIDSGRNLEKSKENIIQDEKFGLLHIPPFDINNPGVINFYSTSNPGLSLLKKLERQINAKIENIRLLKSGIDKASLEQLKSSISINTINLSITGEEVESNSGASTAVGYIGSFLVYFFIFYYGAQCMRGVVEEKSTRIVEVILSSVKPFQLMMGKIVGIALVALTQFILWIILTASLSTLAGKTLFDLNRNMPTVEVSETQQQEPDNLQNDGEEIYSFVSSALGTLDIPKVILSFIFYFLGGYLLYGALFAAIGSASDSDADTQQFMFPVTVPLIISIVVLGAVLNDPEGSLAFWMSVLPLFSPVVMMMRIPFGVPAFDLVLSMVLLIAGFLLTVWFAGRIYRVGILIHGSKINYKTIFKWFMMRS